MMGCAIADTGNANPFVPAFARQVGIYKMNADGTYADEGGFGNAGYTTDDGGNSPAASGQMPNSAGYDPYIIRIGRMIGVTGMMTQLPLLKANHGLATCWPQSTCSYSDSTTAIFLEPGRAR